jgi:hypothetical protein
MVGVVRGLHVVVTCRLPCGVMHFSCTCVLSGTQPAVRLFTRAFRNTYVDVMHCARRRCLLQQAAAMP